MFLRTPRGIFLSHVVISFSAGILAERKRGGMCLLPLGTHEGALLYQSRPVFLPREGEEEWVVSRLEPIEGAWLYHPQAVTFLLLRGGREECVVSRSKPIAGVHGALLYRSRPVFFSRKGEEECVVSRSVSRPHCGVHTQTVYRKSVKGARRKCASPAQKPSRISMPDWCTYLDSLFFRGFLFQLFFSFFFRGQGGMDRLPLEPIDGVRAALLYQSQ